MESIRKLSEAVRNRLNPPLREPGKEQLVAAYQEVAAATAQILTPYNTVATGFTVHMRGATYLVTNAHVVNNRQDDLRGFNFEGHSYFLIAKDNGIALAEVLAMNPTGSPCRAAPTFVPNEPLRDIAILRLVAPQKTRHILEEFAFDPSLDKALHQALRNTHTLAPMVQDNRLTAEELDRMIRNFSIRPIRVDSPEIPKQTPSAYSVAYHTNIPVFTHGVTEGQYDNGILKYRFDRKNPVIKGHSGSLTFDVDAGGKVVPLGVTVGPKNGDNLSYAVPFAEVWRGVHAYESQRLVESVNIPRACEITSNNITSWFKPSPTPDVRMASHPLTKPAAITVNSR